MTSLTAKLNRVKAALTPLTSDVYHYHRVGTAKKYIVWMEDGEDSGLHTDNGKSEQAISGTVDLFTLTEFDDLIDDIQDALEGIVGCGWQLLSVQYEEETGFVHYQWSWVVS